MLIHNDFCFYHLPKVGGTSVIELLKKTRLGFIQLGNKHQPLSAKGCNLRNYTIYANIRNPFDRVVSMYEYNRQGGWRTLYKEWNMTFDKFVSEIWYPNTANSDELKSMDEHLFIDGQLPENVVLVKLEEINERWPQIIKQHFGVNVAEVPKANTTQHGDPMSYYTDETREQLKTKEGWACGVYNL